jgi:uncharacterized OsmC-like protein
VTSQSAGASADASGPRLRDPPFMTNALPRPAVSGGNQPDSALFVVPTRRGEGFRASVRGRMLDLADPGSDHRLAPTPDDLFILSIASDLAWSARSYLRAHGLAGDVSVSADWRTQEDPRSSGIDATVMVSQSTEATRVAMAASLEDSAASRPLRGLLQFRVCAE